MRAPAEKTCGAPVFERYEPDSSKARCTHEIPYKAYNMAQSTFKFKPNQNTKYDNIKGHTVVRRTNPNPEAKQNYPRPHLGSLGAIRAPDGWNPVTQTMKAKEPVNTMQQL